MDSDQVWINFTTMKNFLELNGKWNSKGLNFDTFLFALCPGLFRDVQSVCLSVTWQAEEKKQQTLDGKVRLWFNLESLAVNLLQRTRNEWQCCERIKTRGFWSSSLRASPHCRFSSTSVSSPTWKYKVLSIANRRKVCKVLVLTINARSPR